MAQGLEATQPDKAQELVRYSYTLLFIAERMFHQAQSADDDALLANVKQQREELLKKFPGLDEMRTELEASEHDPATLFFDLQALLDGLASKLEQWCLAGYCVQKPSWPFIAISALSSAFTARQLWQLWEIAQAAKGSTKINPYNLRKLPTKSYKGMS
jgi:hypothetical protein